MKTANEIRECIENIQIGKPGADLMLANAVVWLCEIVDWQETRLRRTSNVSDCLANGIKPD